MRRIFGVIGLLVIIGFVGYLVVLPVQADAAPPPPPEGMNIEPGEEYTMVQMVAEEVLVDVGLTVDEMILDPNLNYGPTGYRVAFNCTFWMVNQGEEAEQLMVRFPIHAPYDEGVIDIESIRVNGDPVEWYDDEFDFNTMYDEFAWAHFDVTFPVGEEVEIKIVYTTLTKRDKSTNVENLNYILETGAGWHGPIGQGRIIFRIPYPANTLNVDLSATYPDAVFEGADMVWEFTDLEPTWEDNWYIKFISPESWLEIDADLKRLESSPNNTSALVRLAEAVYLVCVEPRSATFDAFSELFEEGFAAAEKAVTLVPDSFDNHVLYAKFLAARLNPERYALLEEELAYISEMDPGHDVIGLIDWTMQNYTYSLTVTAEAQLSPTPKPSETLKPTNVQTPPTETPLPSTPTATPRRATQTPEPAPGTGNTTSTDAQPEDDGRTGYYIAVGLLAALMVLNRYLAWRDKQKKR